MSLNINLLAGHPPCLKKIEIIEISFYGSREIFNNYRIIRGQLVRQSSPFLYPMKVSVPESVAH